MATSNQLIRRELVLEGLDCAHCAAKIEQGVSEIEGIGRCTVNFANQSMILDIPHEEEESLIAKASELVRRVEPHVQVRPAFRSGSGSAASAGRSAEVHSHEQTDESAREHSQDREQSTPGNRVLIGRLIAGAAIAAAALLLPGDASIGIGLYAAAYLMVGGDIVLRAVRNIARGEVFDEFFLMALATIGAFAVGQYPEGVAVMLFYQIGELFQSTAVNRSRRSIKSLLAIRPDYANVLRGREERKLSPEEVHVGDQILIKPGERVPLDGIVLEGSSFLDTSALTGESLPREASVGSAVLSGSINGSGVLKVEVTREFAESTASKILELVQSASANKAKTETFITKFARYYTPVVVIAALLLAVVPPLVINGAEFSDWVYRALIFLVISCPCALVVSIPLGFFGGIGAASKEGILVKGSNFLEALNDAKYVVFDKTGTLTKGVFQVSEITPAARYSAEELLAYAASAEAYSSHPIAVSIRSKYGKEIRTDDLSDYAELSGHGVRVSVRGETVLAGNDKLMEREGILYEKADAAGTVAHLAVNGRYAGSIRISDEVKEDSAAAIRELKELGIRKTVMLTGDTRRVGEAVGRTLGLDEVHSELLPEDKVREIEKLEKRKAPREKILFVGDGINDTPVLARADVGIAMGGLGSDAAIEAADVVIMTDQPSKLAAAIRIARRTRRIVWQNIIFALAVKGIFLLLGAFGIATMWEAVFSDVGVTVLAVLNSMRVLRAKPKPVPAR